MAYGLLTGRPFSPTTIKVYEYYSNWYFERFEEVSISNLKQALIQVPVVHQTKRLKIYQAILCFSQVLIENDELPKEFIIEVKPFRPKQHLPTKRITVEETNVQKLLEVADNELDRFLVVLLANTGLRVTEAANLVPEDIDVEKKVLCVQLAKWGKSRRLGLIQEVIDAYKAYLPKRPLHDSNRLFINSLNKPMDRYGIRVRLKKLGVKAKVDVTPHALRRAFVTINANKGRPLPMLQIACGHSDITTTRSYCLTTEDETIEAMKQWR
ncbi:MAG: tyrosine-type recombinase/integrase [Vampirovibrionales bacterium]|nr:tyrosine-type recombinase/integrase [Vampirovibrionales bacterium]